MTGEFISIITDHINRNIYHGASLALFKGGKWQEYYIGTTDGLNPVKEDLIYDLASVSKVVGVGTICIFMINNGALELDYPLKYYYHDFENDKVTVRQLLTHTSGLDPFIPNRDQLTAEELIDAMNHLKERSDNEFLYSDVNFILLGLMLERIYGQDLDSLIESYVLRPFEMTETSFGPRVEAVPTVKGISDGIVHDPKARVLKNHAGSAGLFSSLKDLEKFISHYSCEGLKDKLFQNYNGNGKTRSIAWRLEDNWIDHTGYTGPFIMMNDKDEAVIFLTNRTYECDERAAWIRERDLLMKALKESFL